MASGTPSASFSYTVSGLTVTFVNTSTDSTGGDTIVSSLWTFGDGNTSSQTNPTYTYSSAGTYTVTLLVTDNTGATSTISQSVNVYAGADSGGCMCDGNGTPILPNWPLFIQQFPQFANMSTGLLQMYWNEVTCFVCDSNYGQILGSCRLYLINLFVAHMITLMNQVTANPNAQGGFVTSSTVGQVSVSKLAPPSPDAFSYWLNQTPYGQMALALLDANTVGGDYIGGLGEIGGFRRANGIFYPQFRY